MPEDAQPLEAALHEAETELKSTLDEACRTDPLHADTGELIRIEEILSIASDAAKRAVSVRRKMRQQVSRRDEERLAAEEAVDTLSAHRDFIDSQGVHWAVWSVHPAQRETRRSQLRGSYSNGWLAFESIQEKRRLSPIPEGWEQLEAPELEGLCRIAEPARHQRARRSGEGAADSV